jgi:cobalt-zinc-cadmium efflux system membrane fusion protein
MPSRIWTLGAWAASYLPTVLTLALLGGLALWGYHNDWKVPSLAAKAADPETETAAAAVKVIPEPGGSDADVSASLAVRRARLEFSSADAVRAAGIQVATARARDMVQYVTANGMLDYQPYRYAQLASRAPGTIWRVVKEMGEPVRKGEVLALIESTDVGRTKADFLHSLHQVEVRTAALERLKSAGGAVAGGSLRETEATLREARIRLFNDHQRLLNLGLPLRIDDIDKLSEEQQVRSLRVLGLPDEVRKQLDAETLTANLLPLLGPFDGVVVRHPQAAPGEVVDTTRPLFVVADTSQLHIELDINLEDAALLRLGQRVSFFAEDRPAEADGAPEGPATETATGTLAHISPEVNEKSRRVQVHAEVENPDGRLRPNTYGTGRIRVREKPAAVVVPAEALQWEMQPKGRLFFVFVQLSETRFQVRPVKPGLRDGGLVEVEGIEAGATVVTTGSFMLKSELLKERIGGSD